MVFKKISDVGLQCGYDPCVLERRRSEPACNSANTFRGLLESLTEVIQHSHARLGVLLLTREAQPYEERREALCGVVVQFSGNSLPFVFCSPERTLSEGPELPAFGHVADDRDHEDMLLGTPGAQTDLYRELMAVLPLPRQLEPDPHRTNGGIRMIAGPLFLMARALRPQGMLLKLTWHGPHRTAQETRKKLEYAYDNPEEPTPDELVAGIENTGFSLVEQEILECDPGAVGWDAIQCCIFSKN